MTDVVRTPGTEYTWTSATFAWDTPGESAKPWNQATFGDHYDVTENAQLRFGLGAITAAFDAELWKPGVTPTGYSLNQSVAGESIFDVRTGPFGGPVVANICIQKDTGTPPDGADGGWSMNAPGVTSSDTQGYLYAVFMKRVGATAGSAYWGMHSDAAGGIHCKNLNDTDNTNPYFMTHAATTALPVANTWYLVIGYLHPAAYAGADAGISGVYSMAGSKLVDLNEFKQTSGTTAIRHRSYHYYNYTDALDTELQQMWRPMIIPCSVADAPAVISAILAGVHDTHLSSLSVDKAVSEAFAIAEARTMSFSMAIAQTLAFVESMNDTTGFNLNFGETLTFAETVAKDFTLAKSETIAFVEAVSKNYGLNQAEAFAFAQAFARTVSFNLSIAETVNFAETVAKNYGMNKAETIAFIDELRKRPLAVISDMISGTGDVTLEEFEEMIENGHAPGYEKFKQFLAGDYDYQRAIFRAILESSSADRAVLQDLKLVVDVPDVHDTGTATISVAASGVTVNFARTFHVTPDVQLTLKGGTTVAIPRIESVSTTGFTAKLLDTAGNPVTGTFTWAADGY
jgi:hypothetical protein